MFAEHFGSFTCKIQSNLSIKIMYFSFVMYLSRKLICVACCMKLAKQTLSE